MSGPPKKLTKAEIVERDIHALVIAFDALTMSTKPGELIEALMMEDEELVDKFITVAAALANARAAELRLRGK